MAPISAACRLLLAATLAASSSIAASSEAPANAAAPLEVEGVAVIGADLAAARQAAIRDALGQAALLASARVQVQSDHSPDQLLERTSVQARVDTAGAEIIEESQQDGVLRVRIRTRVLDAPACGSTPPAYRKRIAWTPFPIRNPSQRGYRDSGGFERGLADLLGNRLTQRGELLPGTEANAQVRLEGEIVEFVRQESPVPKALQWIPNWVPGTPPPTVSLTLELRLIGTLSGEVFWRRRLARLDMPLPAALPAGDSEALRNNPAGRGIVELIDVAAEEITTALRCQPLVAQVIAVKKGEASIDAGSMQGLSSGDSLSLHASAAGRLDARAALQNPDRLDERKRPAAVLTLTEVYPQHAIGRFEPAAAPGLRRGDIVTGP